MTLLGLLITLIVICLLFWAVGRILAAFSIGDPIATVVYVLMVLVVVFWLIGQVGGVSLGSLRLR